MAKKFSLLLAAVAVLAFAVPAMASASTGLTMPAGTLVPVTTEASPSILQGKSTNSVASKTGVGTLTCKEVILKGEVFVNSASAGVEGRSGKQTSTTSECFREGTTKITVKEIKLEKLLSTASEAGTGKITASYVAVVGGLNCKFQLTNANATYTANSSTIQVTNQAQTVTPASCGVGGTFSGTYSLETPAGGAVIIM